MKLVSAPRVLGVVLTVAVAAFLVPMAYATLNEDGPAANIGAGYVELTAAQVSALNLVDAFIPTRSANRKCLVTLAESNGPLAGRGVACVTRTFNGVEGVRIVVGYLTDLPSDFVLSLTVYQQGARRYGPPVLYTGP